MILSASPVHADLERAWPAIWYLPTTQKVAILVMCSARWNSAKCLIMIDIWISFIIYVQGADLFCSFLFVCGFSNVIILITLYNSYCLAGFKPAPTLGINCLLRNGLLQYYDTMLVLSNSCQITYKYPYNLMLLRIIPIKYSIFASENTL